MTSNPNPEIDNTKIDLTMQALAGAVDNRRDWQDPAMEALYAYNDPALLYGACTAWATAVRTVVGKPAEGEFFGLVAINVETGELGGLDDVPIPAYAKQGIRFIIAVGNEDNETALALFNASAEGAPGDGDGLVAAVLFLAGRILHAHSASRKERRKSPRPEDK